MNLIELLIFVFLFWLSVLAGGFAYDRTHHLGVSMLAAMVGMYAIPGVVLCLCWLSDRLGKKRPTVHETAVAKEKLRNTIILLLMFSVPVVIGQFAYAATSDQGTAFAFTVGPFAFICVVLSCIHGSRARSKRR